MVRINYKKFIPGIQHKLTIIVKKREPKRKAPTFLGTFDFFIFKNYCDIYPNKMSRSLEGTPYPAKIRREERPFCKYIYSIFGEGDYAITFVKQRISGFKRFFNGIILNDKFMRRKNDPLITRADSVITSPTSFLYSKKEIIGYLPRYLIPQRPAGVFHSF